MHLQLHHPTAVLQGDIGIESSKSISNRALIINALTNNKCTLTHLSTANDTLLLQRLLAQQTTEYNAEDAGTTFRFLTAYLSIQPFDSTLTGTSRMMQRPIAPLVDALRQIGATIQYLKNEGFPPLKILGSKFRQQTSTVAIRADISSQFISALLLIAPRLPKGLHINLEGFVTSEPYINMTLAIMQYFSIRYQQTPHTIIIEHQAYQPKLLAVEADWSSAAYYYAMAGIAQSAHIRLRGLTQNSWQGDAVIASIATFFGVHTYYKNNYIEIKKAAEQLPKSKLFEYDFSNAPDIAPTVIILCAALGIQGLFSGLETLIIKETDRIAALQVELQKTGCSLVKLPTRFSKTLDKEFYLLEGKAHFSDTTTFATYGDHRMAMGLAALAILHPINILDTGVVKKSHPTFWECLKDLAFVVKKYESSV